MKKFFRKHRTCIIVISVILVTTLLVGIVAASTNVIGKISNSNVFGTRDRNPDNAFDVEWYSALDGTRQDGIKISVDEDGVITLNGTATKDGEISLEQDEDLDGDEYLYVSGVLDGSIDTYFLKVAPYGGNNPVYLFNGDVCMAPEETGMSGEFQIRVWIGYKDGTKFDNVKIYPTIGIDESVDFYS